MHNRGVFVFKLSLGVSTLTSTYENTKNLTELRMLHLQCIFHQLKEAFHICDEVKPLKEESTHIFSTYKIKIHFDKFLAKVAMPGYIG